MKDVSATSLTGDPIDFNQSNLNYGSNFAQPTSNDQELMYLLQSLAIQRDDDIKTFDARSKRQLWLDVYMHHTVNDGSSVTASVEANVAVTEFEKRFGDGK